nr:DEAD/DEAH box helicase [Desulfobacula sp.]
MLHPDDVQDLDAKGMTLLSQGKYFKARDERNSQVQTIDGLAALDTAFDYSFVAWFSDTINETGQGAVFRLPTEDSFRADDIAAKLAALLGMHTRKRALPEGPEETDITFRDFYTSILPSIKDDNTSDGAKDLAFQEFMESPAIAAKADLKLYRDGVLEMAMRPDNFNRLFADEAQEHHPGSNVLLAGPTGCGKTDLAMSLILNEVLENEGMAIYVGPTRMLVQEVYATLVNMLPESSGEFGQRLDKAKDIVLSTGEDTDGDWKSVRATLKWPVSSVKRPTSSSSRIRSSTARLPWWWLMNSTCWPTPPGAGCWICCWPSAAELPGNGPKHRTASGADSGCLPSLRKPLPVQMGLHNTSRFQNTTTPNRYRR